MIKELHIIVPGILGALANLEHLADSRILNVWLKQLAQTKTTQQVLNNSGSRLLAYEQVLTDLFKLKSNNNFSSANLSLLTSQQYDKNLHYMFADPVHLEADLNQVILSGATDLNISEQENELLHQQIQQHIKLDNLKLIQLNQQHWVIVSKNKIDIQTTPLDNAIGRDINYLLAKGKDAKKWNQLLTELQMLLYSHEINAQREQKSQMSINSVWFYGEGELPEFEKTNLTIASSSLICVGLAKLTSNQFIALSTVENYIDDLLKSTVQKNILHLHDLNHLVNYNDTRIWLTAVEKLLINWIIPLQKVVYQHNIKLYLYPCLGERYQFSKNNKLKFWKKSSINQQIKTY